MTNEMYQDVLFWVGTWFLAAISGTCRAVRDRDYNNLSSLVSLGLFSGLVGFGVVSIIVGSSGGYSGNEPRYLGLATLLGLVGKEQDKLIRFVIRRAFTALGVIDEQSKSEIILSDRMDPNTGANGSDTDRTPKS